MRIYVKGGVWSNEEDRVLEVGVSKYGLYAWDRVATMLPRKNAMLAEARWNEYLDPSIRKTPWTKEEDERLLQLARLFPGAWRSVAEQVDGRTATQCARRFDELMSEISGAQRGTVVATDYLLEARDARSDAKTLSAHDTQMLDDARGRASNISGKKGLRAQRAAQLRETKLLTAIQKRRELRAAGIDGQTDPLKRWQKALSIEQRVAAGGEPEPSKVGAEDANEAFAPMNLEDIRVSRKRTRQMATADTVLDGEDGPGAATTVKKAVKELPPTLRAPLQLDLFGKAAAEGGKGLPPPVALPAPRTPAPNPSILKALTEASKHQNTQARPTVLVRKLNHLIQALREKTKATPGAQATRRIAQKELREKEKSLKLRRLRLRQRLNHEVRAEQRSSELLCQTFPLIGDPGEDNLLSRDRSVVRRRRSQKTRGVANLLAQAISATDDSDVLDEEAVEAAKAAVRAELRSNSADISTSSSELSRKVLLVEPESYESCKRHLETIQRENRTRTNKLLNRANTVCTLSSINPMALPEAAHRMHLALSVYSNAEELEMTEIHRRVARAKLEIEDLKAMLDRELNAGF